MAVIREPEAAAPPDADALRRRQLRSGPLLVLFPGAVTAVAPEPSLAWAIVAGTAFAVSFALMLLVVDGGRYHAPRWSVGYTIVNLDLLALGFVAFAWRLVGSDGRLGILLLAVVACAVAAAHRFRREVLRELSFPTSRLGKVLAGFATIGAGAAGALGMAVGAGLPRPVLGGSIVVVGLYVLIASHALWIGAEDPDWTPTPRPPKPRRTRGARR